MSGNHEINSYFGIRQTREVDGKLHSLVVEMFRPGVSLDEIIKIGAGLIAKHGAAVDILRMFTGRNYKALGSEGVVMNCRFGVFDDEFRDRLIKNKFPL